MFNNEGIFWTRCLYKKICRTSSSPLHLFQWKYRKKQVLFCQTQHCHITLVKYSDGTNANWSCKVDLSRILNNFWKVKHLSFWVSLGFIFSEWTSLDISVTFIFHEFYNSRNFTRIYFRKLHKPANIVTLLMTLESRIFFSFLVNFILLGNVESLSINSFKFKSLQGGVDHDVFKNSGKVFSQISLTQAFRGEGQFG